MKPYPIFKLLLLLTFSTLIQNCYAQTITPLEAYAITNAPIQGIVTGNFIVLLSDTTSVQQIQVQLGTNDGDVSLVNQTFTYDVTTGLPQGFSYNRINNKITLGFSIVTDPATLFGQVRLKDTNGQWSDFLKFVTN